MSTSDLKKYFYRKKPVGGVFLVIIGALLFLLGISVDGGYLWAIIGAAVAALGVFLIVKSTMNKSDGAVDNYCNTLADEYFAMKGAIVASYGEMIGDTCLSGGYCFENIFSARKARKGKDSVWRSSIFEMSCMFFTRDMVYYYSKKISLITDEKSEIQKDFRLKDIQMVSLEELNQSVVVAIAIPGNEKLFVNCRNKEEAISLCDRIKAKSRKKEGK